jgi:hypothetical protein
VINIYSICGIKFLKWCDNEGKGEFYTQLDSIITFGSYPCQGEDLLAFTDRFLGHKAYTTYKFSDLEDVMNTEIGGE